MSESGFFLGAAGEDEVRGLSYAESVRRHNDPARVAILAAWGAGISAEKPSFSMEYPREEDQELIAKAPKVPLAEAAADDKKED